MLERLNDVSLLSGAKIFSARIKVYCLAELPLYIVDCSAST